MNMGNQIKKLRQNKKLTQKQLAELVNVTTNTIQNYENNRRTPNWETIKKIAEVFDINPTELILAGTIDKLDASLDMFNNNPTHNLPTPLTETTTDFNLKEYMNSTVYTILTLSKPNYNYSIYDFSPEDIDQLTNFLTNAFTLKVNELLENKK